jgi:hypothetical protein
MIHSPDEIQPRPEDDPEIAALLNFKPAPRQNNRKDGWTPALQRKFIAHLARTGSPHQAAEALGKNRHGVQKVYKSKGADRFRAAWDAAVALYEERAAEWIEREQASFSTPPYFDRRRKRAQEPEEGEWTEVAEHRTPLPVVCDKCSAEGVAGDEAFADIPYLLAFDPVPRPAHDRLWDPATQRAFVAALAMTGSIERAARSIRRHGFAVEKLRKSRGAREFNEACEAALDVARQRELANVNLTSLNSPSPLAGEGWGEGDERAEYEAARERIQMRLMNCRRLYLWEICEDEAKRAAWELLCGPTDWEKAKRPMRGYGANDAAGAFETGSANMREPSMILPVENGWLTDLGGPTQDGRDKMAELRAEVEKEEAEQKMKQERRSPAHLQFEQPGNVRGPLPAKRAPLDSGRIATEREKAGSWRAGQVTALPARGETGVQAETDNEEGAMEAFKEWQAHVDAGRIGKKR